MAILNNNPLVGASGNQGGYNINNSLRFRSSASASLSRTPASSGNRKTWTWSAWVKRGTLSVQLNTLLVTKPSSSPNDTNTLQFSFNSDNALTIGLETAYYLTTTQVFRDTSAWYHLVLAVDTTQATASNRIKIYVNGSQVTAFSVDLRSSITQNQDLGINLGSQLHQIGSLAANTWYFDGYLADVNFIDGSAKTPSDFGETDTTTGVWKPKAYSGTYGTNGFYLKFSDIATTSGSNAGLGKDFSGNSNYWTTNNISVTSGVTYDAMTDSPTNTSATVANYCVANPLILRTSGTISNANLSLSCSSGWKSAFGTMTFPSTGKYYFELTASDTNNLVGIATIDSNLYNAADNYFTLTATSYGYYGGATKNTGPGNTSSSYGASYGSGDIIGVAFDVDAGTLTFYKNNVSQGTAFTGITGSWVPAIGVSTIGTIHVNFGQRPFAYTPPTGYLALNTFNLPNPTILQGNKYMDATLYTGNGSTQVIVNQAQFKPDLVWVKARSVVRSHKLTDSVRGATKVLASNNSDAEDTNTTGLTAFNSNGFTLGADTNYNDNTVTFVGWQWQAGQGSTSSNTSGSITSTVSVNTTAGFSIVTYTNSAGRAAHTVGHGLGVAPRMFIIKTRSATADWVVYHASLGATQALYLNQTLSAQTSSTFFNNTAPTSTIMTLGSGLSDAGTTIVAYCFAEIAGFSKFNSYTGNGSADGPFIATNFAPKYVMIKQTNTTGDWQIFDTSRSPTNVASNTLYANGSFAEDSNVTNRSVDFLSNGFKIRSSGTFINASGGTFIYMAFAENPTKFALAR